MQTIYFYGGEHQPGTISRIHTNVAKNTMQKYKGTLTCSGWLYQLVGELWLAGVTPGTLLGKIRSVRVALEIKRAARIIQEIGAKSEGRTQNLT